MSSGALKIDENTYQPLDSKTPVTRENVENYPYLKNDNSALTQGFNFPPESVPLLNRQIGNLVANIQETSFMPPEILNSIHLPSPFDTILGKDQKPGPFSISTLQPLPLINTIRDQLAKAIRDIFALFEKEKQEKPLYNHTRSIAPSPPKKYPPPETFLTKGTFSNKEAHYKSILETSDFFTPESKELLSPLGDHSIAAVQTVFKRSLEFILTRAELSVTSLHGDIQFIRKKLKANLPYSTLNPNDLLPMMPNIAEGFLNNLIFSLPPEQQTLIFERLNVPSAA